MKRNYYISVAMATYNGEKFIRQQLESILKQLQQKDEIIISDDGSIDETINIVKSFKDKRIKIIKGPQKGVILNFANAISNCTGKYIFLSDQDDIWLDNKVNTILKYFEETQCDCITHNNDVINEDNSRVIIEDFFKYRKSKPGLYSNIYKNKYLGCTMTFKSDMKTHILPIPNDIDMHDQWIGLVCDKYGKSIFVKEKLIHYRRHSGNVSSMNHYSLWKMIKKRLIIIKRIWSR